jgi:hypothetical protein
MSDNSGAPLSPAPAHSAGAAVKLGKGGDNFHQTLSPRGLLVGVDILGRSHESDANRIEDLKVRDEAREGPTEPVHPPNEDYVKRV